MTSSTGLGVHVPVHGPLSAGGAMRMARLAEDEGADSLWIGDHILLVEPATGYPFDPTGVYPAPTDSPLYESLTVCAMLAAATHRIRVGTGVLVLPQRNVLQLAKTAATIDAISGGRFVLGVGAGWFAGEMEALGYDFATRGRRMDEQLAVLRDAWTGRPTAFDGDEVTVPPSVQLFPTPLRARVPTIVGGLSKAAIRRAIEFGDGWMDNAPAEDFHPAERIRLFEQVRSASLDRDGFQIILKITCTPGRVSELPERIAEVVHLGYDEIIVQVPWSLGFDAVRDVLHATRTALSIN